MRNFQAVQTDYAEFFEHGEETEAGDVIALNENSSEERYLKATKWSKLVVGVHSDQFAHLIGGEKLLKVLILLNTIFLSLFQLV